MLTHGVLGLDKYGCHFDCYNATFSYFFGYQKKSAFIQWLLWKQALIFCHVILMILPTVVYLVYNEFHETCHSVSFHEKRLQTML